MVTASELNVNTSVNAAQMAQAMFGSGVQVVNATYTGAAVAKGIYTGGNATSPGVVPSDTGVILSTGRATDFTNSSGQSNVSTKTSTQNNTAGDSQLTQISGNPTRDAAVFQADFIPLGDTLTMQISFSSEEYLEYVGTQFNDVCAIWVNGVQAQLTVGNGDITINNINGTSNQNLYVDNAQDQFNTEMDAFTITLTLKAPVNVGVVNTIKIGIADAGDRLFDSNLLIAGDSIQCVLVAGDDAFDVGQNGSVTVDLIANDVSTTGATLTITQINGVNVVAGSVVTLSTGEKITLNADGTITLLADGDITTSTFTYTVKDSAGNTDVAFVTVNTVPCFARGTRLLTPRGQVAVEALALGDLVVTRDHGAQPVRWIGVVRVSATGRMAPVVIEAGTFGPHDRLRVSPQHRIFLQNSQAELMFGQSEVLVAALHLVNDVTVRVDRSEAEVEYFHILFDRHEIVWSEGLETESFHPGRATLDGMGQAARAELLALFPGLESVGSYGPAARRSLRAREALLLAENRARI